MKKLNIMNRALVGSLREGLVNSSTIKVFGPKAISSSNFIGCEKLTNKGLVETEYFSRNMKEFLSHKMDSNYFHLSETRGVIESIISDAPIFLIVSTGRSGTMSLCKLFEEKLEGYRGFHHLPLVIGSNIISEYYYRTALNKFPSPKDNFRGQGSREYYADLFFRSRLVELLSRNSTGIVFCNHWDSFFAHLVLTCFRNSRIIVLNRNPIDVVYSHISSAIREEHRHSVEKFISYIQSISATFPQSKSYLTPLDVFMEKSSGVLFSEILDFDPIDQNLFCLEATKRYCQAIEMAEGFGERLFRINMDRMFSQSSDELSRFLDIFHITNEKRDIVNSHFSKKINVKTKIHDRNYSAEVRKFLEKKVSVFEENYQCRF